MSFNINSDGTFVFKGNTFYLNVPNFQKLTSEQQKEMVQKIEKLLEPHLQTLNNLDGVKVETQGIRFQDREVNYSPPEQEIFKEVQNIAIRTLPPPIQKKSLPPFPQSKTKKKGAPHFGWPPESLKVKVFHQWEKLKQFADHHQFNFNEYHSFDQAEIQACLQWATKAFTDTLMPDPKIPSFFKQEFKQWLNEMQIAASWEGVQKVLEGKIEQAYKAKWFDPLFGPAASDKENQLGHLFLHLFQADHPDFLEHRLESADKIIESIPDSPERERLVTLLEELHAIVDPLLYPPLKGRVKPSQTLPSQSHLAKITKAVLLVFSAIGHLFLNPARWHDPQTTPPSLSTTYTLFNEESIGSEEIKRYPSVLQLIASKEARLSFLSNQKPPPDAQIESLRKEIDRYKKLSRKLSWIPSNYIREQVANKKGENYLPAIVNGRMHTVATEKEGLTIHRSGALSYLIDGSTNLLDLKAKTMKQWKKEIKADSYEAFRKNAADYLATHKEDKLVAALERIDKRQQALNDQMVQYLGNQIKGHIVELVDPSQPSVARLTRTIPLTQISLLNPQSKERHQFLDMAALFAQFNGKQIQFTAVTAPFMDGNTIYFPLSMLKDPNTKQPIANPDIATPFKLSCCFFNLSVQGQKTNTGEQKEINQYGLQRLKENLNTLQTYLEAHPDAPLHFPLLTLSNRLDALEERLEQGESSYTLAKDIARLQHDMQGCIGINCYSGKDRTSYLMIEIIDSLLSDFLKEKEELSEEEKNALQAKWQQELTDLDHGLASQVVHQNTGHKVLKIQEKEVIGINKGLGFSGHILRLAHALLALSART